MRIGPEGVDPLYEPGKLVLVSVSEDYEPDEDESRDSVEFAKDGSIVAVDGITGSLSVRVETDPDQRRALLRHLLEAEAREKVEVDEATRWFEFGINGVHPYCKLWKHSETISVHRDLSPSDSFQLHLICLRAQLFKADWDHESAALREKREADRV